MAQVLKPIQEDSESKECNSVMTPGMKLSMKGQRSKAAYLAESEEKAVSFMQKDLNSKSTSRTPPSNDNKSLIAFKNDSVERILVND